MKDKLQEEKMKRKLHLFVDGLTPIQVLLLDEAIKTLVQKEGFTLTNEKVWLSATGRAGSMQEDVDEGNVGSLYRSPN